MSISNKTHNHIAIYCVLAASACGFAHEIVTILCDPAVAAARNVHGVPPEVVWGMHQALLAERLPTFWNHRVVLPEVQTCR